MRSLSLVLVFALFVASRSYAQDAEVSERQDTPVPGIVFGSSIEFSGLQPEVEHVVFGHPIEFTGIVENDLSLLEEYLEELLAIDAIFDEWISSTAMAQSIAERSLNPDRFTESEFQSWLSDEMRWLFLDFQHLELWRRNDRNISALRQAISELRYEPDQEIVRAGINYFNEQMPAWRQRYGTISERYLICLITGMGATYQAYGQFRRLRANWTEGHEAAFANFEAMRAQAADCVDETALDELTRDPVFEWPIPE